MADHHQFLFVKGTTHMSSFSYLASFSEKNLSNTYCY